MRKHAALFRAEKAAGKPENAFVSRPACGFSVVRDIFLLLAAFSYAPVQRGPAATGTRPGPWNAPAQRALER